MSTGSLLTWMVTFGLLGWAASFVYGTARGFAANPLAGPKMRQVTGLYVPLLQVLFLLSLLGIVLVSRLRGGAREAALSGGLAFVLMLLAVLLPLVTALVVAIQGFTLGERQRRQGDEEGASRLASRGFAILLIGAAGTLVTIFAAGVLANPA